MARITVSRDAWHQPAMTSMQAERAEAPFAKEPTNHPLKGLAIGLFICLVGYALGIALIDLGFRMGWLS